MAAILVTLAQAKAHLLRFEPAGDVLDDDLELKLAAAEAHVLALCSRTPTSKAIADAWTPATAPAAVVASILISFGELARFRGDDVDAVPRETGEDASAHVRALLRPYSDPVVA
jgi:hypothetical protein